MSLATPIVIGNWKMNGLRADGLARVRALRAREPAALRPATLGICPPATLLAAVQPALVGSAILLGGQDCTSEASGAYTGDRRRRDAGDAGCQARHRRPFRAAPRPRRDRRAGARQGGRGAGRRADRRSSASARPRPSGRPARRSRCSTASSRAACRRRRGRQAGRRLRAGLGDRHRPHADAGRHRAACTPICGAARARWSRTAPRWRCSTAARSRPAMPARSWRWPNVDGALVGGASLEADEFLAIYTAGQAARG